MERRLIGFVSLAPAVLLLLKVIEVALEGERRGFGGTLGYGVLRRVDDATFWFVLIAGVGCSRIFAAAFRLSQVPRRRRAPRPERAVVYSLGVLFGLAFIGMLLAEAFASKGMFWWSGEARSGAWLIRVIQWVEGSLVMGSLSVWAFFLVVGIRAGEDLRWLVENEPLRDTMPRRRIREAELLLNGCLAPLQLLAAGTFVVLAALAALAVAELHVPFYGWVAGNMGPVDPLAVAGLLSLGVIPSLVVAGWLHWRWFGLLRWSLGRGFLQRPLWLQCRVESRQFGQ